LPVTSVQTNAPPVHVHVAMADAMPHSYSGAQTSPSAAHGAPIAADTDAGHVASGWVGTAGVEVEVHPATT
jgi:hypothetical protein